MIRYPYSSAEIRTLVDKRHPTWSSRAAARTAQLKALGRYAREGDILPNGKSATKFYGAVKDVFMSVQHCKCIYCESRLERGRIQFDVEHFRPKDAVTLWQSKSLDVPTGGGMTEGYFLLSYNLENLAVACKVCNTIAKGTYFPISSERVLGGESVAAHASEGAYLVYPLGGLADNPEEHIIFDGVTALPRDGSIRGAVTIEVLQLNREGLQAERAHHLVTSFCPAYEGAIDEKPKAKNALQRLLSDGSPYARCTRCYFDLCQDNPERAEELYEQMCVVLKNADGGA